MHHMATPWLKNWLLTEKGCRNFLGDPLLLARNRVQLFINKMTLLYYYNIDNITAKLSGDLCIHYSVTWKEMKPVDLYSKVHKISDVVKSLIKNDRLAITVDITDSDTCFCFTLPRTRKKYKEEFGERWVIEAEESITEETRIDNEHVLCAKCGKSCHEMPLFRCMGCRETFYCSSECHHDHWQYHKHHCHGL